MITASATTSSTGEPLYKEYRRSYLADYDFGYDLRNLKKVDACPDEPDDSEEFTTYLSRRAKEECDYLWRDHEHLHSVEELRRRMTLSAKQPKHMVKTSIGHAISEFKCRGFREIAHDAVRQNLSVMNKTSVLIGYCSERDIRFLDVPGVALYKQDTSGSIYSFYQGETR